MRLTNEGEHASKQKNLLIIFTTWMTGAEESSEFVDASRAMVIFCEKKSIANLNKKKCAKNDWRVEWACKDGHLISS